VFRAQKMRGEAYRRDEQRNARLLFDAELDAGTLSGEALRAALASRAVRRAVRARAVPARPVRRAVRVRAVPPRPVRLAQQALYKLGRRSFERDVIDPPRAARRAVLGSVAETPPRVLIRVDELPHYLASVQARRFGGARFERFHEILVGAGVPYLLAVTPRVSGAPLTPSASVSRGLDEVEVALLRRLASEGVAFALHGREHHTRFASPRRRSELCGLSRAQTEALLDGALAELAGYGIAPDVFVAPFNRFDARQLPWLAARFAVVGGGPESIGGLGFQGTPQWRGETVYLPSYAPFYGRAAEVLAALPRALERAQGLWLPVVLHWGWEADAGWGELERLAAHLAPYAAPWDAFLAAVERSR
jgi:Uncharacterized protein conserved in bacteria (DUF2334)